MRNPVDIDPRATPIRIPRAPAMAGTCFIQLFSSPNPGMRNPGRVTVPKRTIKTVMMKIKEIKLFRQKTILTAAETKTTTRIASKLDSIGTRIKL